MEGSSCNTPLKGGKYLSIIHLCLVHEEEIKIQQATGELYMVILLDPILLEHYRRVIMLWVGIDPLAASLYLT